MGRILRNANDPPGQRSFYIAPGDHEQVNYRLSTFQRFPCADFQRQKSFAASGFYYTGFSDRVKCFSCGTCVDEWTTSDDPSHPAWHSRFCKFVNPRNSENSRNGVSRPGASHSQFNSSPQTTLSSTHRPGSSRVDDVDHVPIPDLDRDLRTAVEDSNRNSMFPCRDPINPHMRSEPARLQTFNDSIHNWPSNRIQAAPQQISQAGFYYLGDRDRVKCWYCNGGLQNWDRFDDPWFEHAKWFPMCEFVLQQKGPEYVHQVVARFPNINRPEMTSLLSRQVSGQRTPAGLVLTSGRPGPELPEIVDPRKIFREQNRKISIEMLSSDLVKQARLMGFSDQVIHAALQRHYQECNSSFSSFRSMIDAILSADDEPIPSEYAHSRSEESAASSTLPSAVDAMQSQIKELERSRTCKCCFEGAATVVLLPCGHLVCCEACAASTASCPLCKIRVIEHVKSFVA